MTTTMPDGSLSTYTRVTVVHPTHSETATATGTAAPGLQTGGASVRTGLTKEISAMLGGAVIVAMAL